MAKTSMPFFSNAVEQWPLISHDVLPRRIRVESSTFDKNPLHLQSCLKRSARRSERLLSSFEELLWEVQYSTWRRIPAALCAGKNEAYPEGFRDGLVERSLHRARKVEVCEDECTKEFRTARSTVFESGDWKTLGLSLLDWYEYKRNCLLRSAWAPFFWSNLDWDWDVGGSLTRLYKNETFTTSAAPIAMIYPDGVSGGAWIVKSRLASKDLPKEVRVEYRNDMGEVETMTYACAAPYHERFSNKGFK